MLKKIVSLFLFLLLANVVIADNVATVRNGVLIRASKNSLGAMQQVRIASANAVTINVTTYSKTNPYQNCVGYVGLLPTTVTTSAIVCTISVIAGMVEGDIITMKPVYTGQTFNIVAGTIIKTSDGANVVLTNNNTVVSVFAVSSNYLQVFDKRNY